MIVYGITNCNTVKKALDWLKANHVDYEFHDFKKLGVSPEKLSEWDHKAGYENFLNKKGTTWRDLDYKAKESIKTSADALQLLQQKTSMIKRPVIEDGNFLFFGFDEEGYKKHFFGIGFPIHSLTNSIIIFFRNNYFTLYSILLFVLTCARTIN